MSIPRRTDREHRLWADLLEPTRLTLPSQGKSYQQSLPGTQKADGLADLLLTLERELANITDSSVDGVVHQIDTLVEMTFQQSEPYYDYLDVYRMAVNQRCRKRPAPPVPAQGR